MRRVLIETLHLLRIDTKLPKIVHPTQVRGVPNKARMVPTSIQKPAKLFGE
jgi:hypothetical protein